jgi:DNA-binding NtrC family response regulator
LQKDGAHPRPTPAISGYRGGTQNERHVILASDDIQLPGLISTILEQSGIELMLTCTGTDVISCLRNALPPLDGAILDLPYSMGELGIRAMVASLRNACPNLGMLLISGHAEDEIRAVRLSQERIWFLPKPFKASDLIAAVRQMLG